MDLSVLLLVAAVILFIAEYFVKPSTVPAGLACFAGSFLASGVHVG